MPKAPEVNYWASRSCYGCTIKGRQIMLAKGPEDGPYGPTYQAALKKFQEEMEIATLGTRGNVPSMRAVFEAWLQVHEKERQANTMIIRQTAARQFLACYPDLTADRFDAKHVRDWIAKGRAGTIPPDGNKPWNESSAQIKYRALGAMLRWAHDEGYLPSDPLPRKSRLVLHSHARDKIVTPEEHDQVLAHFNHPRRRFFKSVVIALENTGARLGEIINARVDDWDDKLGGIVYLRDGIRPKGQYRHKAALHKDRVIFFTGEALSLVRWLIEGKWKGQRIFTGFHSNPYRLLGASGHFTRMHDAIGLHHVTAHSYRHTFATRWLQRSANIDQLAELMGNTAKVIRENYAHLLRDTVSLRDALERVMHPDTGIRP